MIEQSSLIGMSKLHGKTALVTGATNGIGRYTAETLAALGASVIVVGRNESKTDEVVDAIHAAGGDARKAIADLSSQAEIRKLATHIKSEVDRLDILVNNAGAMFAKREETVDGLEMTFALNHLSYFMVTNLLMDLLKRSPSARIVSVSSEAQRSANIDFDDLQTSEGFTAIKAYGRSKLANATFTYELARRLQGTTVTANCLHPGFVGTGFASNNGGMMKIGMSILKPFILSIPKGADTPIWLSASPEMEGKSGGYYQKRQPIQSMPQSYDLDAQRRLWEASEVLTGLKAAVRG